MVLPLLKLGTLAVRTISKPLANKLKQQAGKHPKFRNFIIGIAQKNHRLTTTMQRRIYGHATDVAIRPLNEEKAVQAAVDLIGELFVFSVAVGALIFEVQRNARSEARKEEARKQELEALKQRDEELSKELESLKQKYAELEKLARGRGLAGFFNFRFVSPEPVKSSSSAFLPEPVESASTSQPEPVESTSTSLPEPVESGAPSHPGPIKTFTAAVKSII